MIKPKKEPQNGTVVRTEAWMEGWPGPKSLNHIGSEGGDE